MCASVALKINDTLAHNGILDSKSASHKDSHADPKSETSAKTTGSLLDNKEEAEERTSLLHQ